MKNQYKNAMKVYLVNIGNIIKQSIRCSALIIALIATALLSACQVTEKAIIEDKVSNQLSYSDYYLWLKTLTSKQILAEEKKQKLLLGKPAQDDKEFTLSKLILIYSLPNTSLHQPYKAKRFLNKHLLKIDRQNTENLAFSMLLRDQLNTQLRLLEKQEAFTADIKKQNDEHNTQINQLKLQIDNVNQQLILLKRIDQTINERG